MGLWGLCPVASYAFGSLSNPIAHANTGGGIFTKYEILEIESSRMVTSVHSDFSEEIIVIELQSNSFTPASHITNYTNYRHLI